VISPVLRPEYIVIYIHCLLAVSLDLSLILAAIFRNELFDIVNSAGSG
jgi:hypothetical protein